MSLDKTADPLGGVPCTEFAFRIEHRKWNRGRNALHQLGQPVAPSILFPVFNPEGEPGSYGATSAYLDLSSSVFSLILRRLLAPVAPRRVIAVAAFLATVQRTRRGSKKAARKEGRKEERAKERKRGDYASAPCCSSEFS